MFYDRNYKKYSVGCKLFVLSALATVLQHFFAYTLQHIDFRLLNHKWQNTFGKSHIAKKNSNVSQVNNTAVLQEKVLQYREAPIQVVNVCCITIYCLLTQYIDQDDKLIAPVICFSELLFSVLRAILAEQNAPYNRFLPRPARKESYVSKLKYS